MDIEIDVESPADLDDVRPNNLALPPALPHPRYSVPLASAAEKLMPKFVELHDGRHAEALHVSGVHLANLSNVTVLHLAKSGRRVREARNSRELVGTNHPREC